EVFADGQRDALQIASARYLRSRRWFGGKARTISGVRVRDRIALPRGVAVLALVEVEYADAEPDLYLLPLGITQARRAEEQDNTRSATLIARLRDGALLYEPVADETFAQALLDVVARRRQLKGLGGTVAGTATRAMRELRGTGLLHAEVLKGEQSNTAIVYGQRVFLKLFRRLEPGVNTDLEMTR